MRASWIRAAVDRVPWMGVAHATTLLMFGLGVTSLAIGIDPALLEAVGIPPMLFVVVALASPAVVVGALALADETAVGR